jgi:Tfp pilus assembly protein FimT
VISFSKIAVVIAVLVLVAAIGLSGYELGRNHTSVAKVHRVSTQFAKAQAVADAVYVIQQAYQNSTPNTINAANIAFQDHDAAVEGEVALIHLGSDDRAYFQVRINNVVGDVCIDYGGLSYGEAPSACRKP